MRDEEFIVVGVLYSSLLAKDIRSPKLTQTSITYMRGLGRRPSQFNAADSNICRFKFTYLCQNRETREHSASKRQQTPHTIERTPFLQQHFAFSTLGRSQPLLLRETEQLRIRRAHEDNRKRDNRNRQNRRDEEQSTISPAQSTKTPCTPATERE